MSDKERSRLSKMPSVLVQHEVQKIVLELYALSFRLDGLQGAVDIELSGFDTDENGRYRETRELNLWLSIEHARCTLDDLVIDHLTWASRLPEDYPAKQPRDAEHLGMDIKIGSGRPMRRARKRP